MSGKPSLQELLEVQTHFGLPSPALVEKDWYVVRALAAETAVWPLRRPAVELPVTSFIAEAFSRPPEVPIIACVSLAETIAEKFVALTRRVGAEFARAEGPRDSTLVRHVYDLHAVRAHYEINEVVALVKIIMLADADSYGNQFPAYRENPIAETLRAVSRMAGDPVFAARYAIFLRDMVYGEVHQFGMALSTTIELAGRL